MSTFAIGVSTSRPPRAQPPRRPPPQAGLARTPIRIDIPSFLNPKTSLLKHHMNAPMAFQVAVASVGQSLQERRDYLQEFIQTTFAKRGSYTRYDLFIKILN